MKKVIVFGTGITALAAIRDAANCGAKVLHITTKANDIASYSRYISDVVVVEELQNDNLALLDEFSRQLPEWENALLLPVNDPYIVFTAMHHEFLSRSFVPAIPNWDCLSKVVDKNQLYQLAEKMHVPAPRTALPSRFIDHGSNPASWQYPLILKPFQSPTFFSIYNRKVCLINNPGELHENLEDISSHGIDVMVSEIIPGPETGIVNYICCINEEGLILSEILVQKLRQHPEGFGVGCAVRTIPMIEEVQAAAKTILRSSNIYGLIAVEFKYDIRDKCYKLIEINPRPILYHGLFTNAGVNLVELMLSCKPTKRLNAQPPRYRAYYYWIHEFYDLIELRHRRRGGQYTWKQFRLPYLRRHTFAVASLRDPVPFFKMLLRYLRYKFRSGS